MKQVYCLAGAIATALPLLGLGVLSAPPQALAQPSPLTRLATPQTQRLYRDLVRSGSEDFFRQGREDFEQEIQQLSKTQSSLKDILKIDRSKQVRQHPEPFGQLEFAPNDPIRR